MLKDFDMSELEACLVAEFSDFVKRFPDSLYCRGVKVSDWDSRARGRSVLDDGDFYLYVRRGGSVLGVCHLDFVEAGFHVAAVDLFDGLHVFSTRLDDRLGVYGLVMLSDMLGDSAFDLLLTTGEESGLSSASFFELPEGVDYKWVFQLDRRGLDCVTYGHDSKAFRRALGAGGLSISTGTYSDIASLDMPVCKVNFGIGYHGEHTKMSYVKISDFLKSIKRVSRFILKNKNKRFDLLKVPARRWSYGYGAGRYSSRFSYGRGSGYYPLGSATGSVRDSDGLCLDCGYALLSESEKRFGICDLCMASYERGAVTFVEDSDVEDSDVEDSVGRADWCDICGLGFNELDLLDIDGLRYCSDCLELSGAMADFVDSEDSDSADLDL